MGALFVASEKGEFAGIRARLEGYREFDWSIEYAARGIWKEKECTLVSNGPGRHLALRAFGTAMEQGPYDAVVSTGYCGGLDPRLGVGAVVAATEVCDAGGAHRIAVSLPDPCLAETGSMVSVDRVAVSVAEKAGLRRASGASAVEMEAAGLAEAAHKARLPFFCVRAVSDVAQEAMPLDFNLYRTAEGRFDRRRIALAVLARPGRRIPALLRLRRNCHLAASNLGDFFAGWNI